jgi:protein SCO1/2
MTARRPRRTWRVATVPALLLAAAGALASGPLGPLAPFRTLWAAAGGPAGGAAAGGAAAGGAAGAAAGGPAGGARAAAALRVPDVTLIDQDGRKVRFASDVVAGKVVAVSFIFTTCTTICPPLGATFGKLRRLLGSRVQLISVSVDPLNDTPARLKAWAAKFGGGPGWTLLTGPKPEVDRLLRALQAYTPNFGDHSPLILLGNAATGTWERTSGLVPAADIAARLVRLGAPPAEPRRGAP